MGRCGEFPGFGDRGVPLWVRALGAHLLIAPQKKAGRRQGVGKRGGLKA